MNPRRNWLFTVLAAIGSFFLRPLKGRSHDPPRKPGLQLYRFPGGEQISWADQKNGDLIVHVGVTGQKLWAIEVWRIVATGPVFKPQTESQRASGYLAVNAETITALVPSHLPDKQAESLEAFLMLGHAMQEMRQSSALPESWRRIAGAPDEDLMATLARIQRR